MQARLKRLTRIALVYTAVRHARALSLEQAAAALRNAERMIDEQKMQTRRLMVGGRAALDVGDHIDWQMHESQKQFTEWNSEGLVELRSRREASMLEATECYRASCLQLEQMDSVVRDLRSSLQMEADRRTQRESDDRFLSQRWWRRRSAGEGIDRVYSKR